MRAVLLIFVVAVALGGPVGADTLDEAAIHAEPQYYLMSLPRAPVGEIAEAVLGEALGLPYKVDEDVNAQMRFQLDGIYAPKALAREFGYQLWNVDVALIEKPSDGLWLIPKDELPAALAQGATLVSPLAADAAPARKQVPAATIAAVATQPDTREVGWGWVGWLIGGWAAGVASVIGAMAFRRRQITSVPALGPPRESSFARADQSAPDDLVIPIFAARNRR